VGAKDAERIAVVSADYGFDFFWCHARLFVMECGAGVCGPCNTVARRGAGGQGPGGQGQDVQTCAFLCMPGAKLFFGRTKPMFNKFCGISWFAAIWSRCGSAWWPATAAWRECVLECAMPTADAEAIRMFAWIGSGRCIDLMFGPGRNAAGRGGSSYPKRG
jgi:hypothetical protein